MQSTLNKSWFTICGIVISISLSAQTIQIDNLKDQFTLKNAVKMNGGLSANTIYYVGDNEDREPFLWTLSANVNFNIFGQFNMPFSFTINNLSQGYNYPTPPDRFSMHPSYKWITAHIGDASMNFSPYTLSGIQFTGVGIELAPPMLPVTISAMYGRLVKASEYNAEDLYSIPSYKRMGGGAKVNYNFNGSNFGMTFFAAADDESSLLQTMPRSLNIFPQNNVALSWDVNVNIIKNVTFNLEYGLSVINREIAPLDENDTVPINIHEPQSIYNAFNAGVTYQFFKNTIGVGYERIDPEYHTLGGYYFTNDFENITLNYARPFYKEKITFATSVGLEHDDLSNIAKEKTSRIVGNASLSYAISQNLSTNLSYSNFQSYTNKKNQFDYINQMTEYDNIDTLNFQQLSQNANFSINYNFSQNESRKHNIGFNMNFQETYSKQGNEIQDGKATQNYNFAANYNLSFVPIATQLITAVNTSISNLPDINSIIYGPSIGAMTKLFKKKLSISANISYNTSANNGDNQGDITNLRLNFAYTLLKKNNFSLACLQQLREQPLKGKSKDFTLTFMYSYNF